MSASPNPSINPKLYDFSQWRPCEPFAKQWSQLYRSEVQEASVGLTGEEMDALSGWSVQAPQVRAKHLPLGAKDLFMLDIKSIVVRKCYEELYGIISREKHCRVITGNPGIGKSVFLVYFLHRLAREHLSSKEKGKPSVVLVGGIDKDLWYLFCEDKVYETDTARTVYETLCLEDVCCLFDSRSGVEPPTLFLSKVVVFTSPNREYYKRFEKAAKAPRIYMPVWTLEEMVVARNLSYSDDLDHSTMIARLKIFGRIPRYVFDNANFEKYLEDLGEKIDSVEIGTLQSLLMTFSLNSSTSHMLIHMNVSESYKHKHNDYDFASGYVFDKLLAQFYAKSESDLKRFLCSMYNVESVSSLYGQIFENVVITEFEKGGSYPFRRLSGRAPPDHDAPDGHIEIQPRGVRRERMRILAGEKDRLDADTLYVPTEKNNPAFDAFMPSLGGFQMTRSARHDISERGLRILLPVVGPKRLYFVVPARKLFDEYTEQQLVGADGECVAAERYPGVEQYCVLFDMQSQVDRRTKRPRDSV